MRINSGGIAILNPETHILQRCGTARMHLRLEDRRTGLGGLDDRCSVSNTRNGHNNVARDEGAPFPCICNREDYAKCYLSYRILQWSSALFPDRRVVSWNWFRGSMTFPSSILPTSPARMDIQDG